jgi:hypothetical protein
MLVASSFYSCPSSFPLVPLRKKHIKEKLVSQQQGADQTIQIEEKSKSEIREILETLDKKARISNAL